MRRFTTLLPRTLSNEIRSTSFDGSPADDCLRNVSLSDECNVVILQEGTAWDTRGCYFARASSYPTFVLTPGAAGHIQGTTSAFRRRLSFGGKRVQGGTRDSATVPLGTCA